MEPNNYVKHLKETKPSNNDINILLLGETGVGKSTFINSFANYSQNSTLDEALLSELICLIPARFAIPDENFEDRIISFGCDQNEDTVLGNSSTQGARAYVFPMQYENRNIRLIDTPGIGDSRGIKQDDINFENILDYLSQFEVLHAICFLLKPNVSVINPYFKFCILHLLSRLEKSACHNIIFVYTNSRSTFYRPAETLPILRKILKDIEDGPTKVAIPCTKDNMFCMDNEAFKFLIALKNGIKFGDREYKDFSASWETSAQATNNLIAYIAGDYQNKGLIPHKISQTLSVNEARQVIIDLSKPLADISDMVNDNLIILDRHRKDISQDNMSMNDLVNILFIPSVQIIEKELSNPVTVCTAINCSEKYTVNGMTKYHYKQRCHNPCGLRNVPKKIIGTPELVNCSAMSGAICQVCGCGFQTHMHIRYETELESVKLEDSTVKSKIKNMEDAVKAKEKLIKTLNERSLKYEEEKKIISECMAKFAHFLKENSITPYNDAYGDYLDYLIDRERSSGTKKDDDIIKRYEEMKKQYTEEKTILDNALKHSNNDGNATIVVSLNDIFNSVNRLYELPLSGEKIKTLHLSQKKSRKNEYDSSMEYVHIKKQRKNRNYYGYGYNYGNSFRSTMNRGMEMFKNKFSWSSPSTSNNDKKY